MRMPMDSVKPALGHLKKKNPACSHSAVMFVFTILSLKYFKKKKLNHPSDSLYCEKLRTTSAFEHFPAQIIFGNMR